VPPDSRQRLVRAFVAKNKPRRGTVPKDKTQRDYEKQIGEINKGFGGRYSDIAPPGKFHSDPYGDVARSAKKTAKKVYRAVNPFD
jgi:hypothetical protein